LKINIGGYEKQEIEVFIKLSLYKKVTTMIINIT